jgi:hypothetical protein
MPVALLRDIVKLGTGFRGLALKFRNQTLGFDFKPDGIGARRRTVQPVHQRQKPVVQTQQGGDTAFGLPFARRISAHIPKL